MLGDRERCLAAGMDDYLSKPFNQNALVTLLTRWLERGKAESHCALSPAPKTMAATEPIVSIAVSPVKNVSAQEPAASEIPRQHANLIAPPVFDPVSFQNCLPAGIRLDSPLARKIMQLFVGESAKLLAQIEHAAMSADTQVLFRAAHSLKSSAASVGASALSGLAKTLEAQARAGQTGALADHPALLRLAYARFCNESAVCEMLEPEAAEKSAA